MTTLLQQAFEFVASFRRLLRRIQDLARKNYRLWKGDPAHPQEVLCNLCLSVQ
jgi:hypothetical protein